MEGRWPRRIADGKSPRTVLLVSRIEQDRLTLRTILDQERLQLYTAISVSEAIAILLDESVPVVICGCHVLGGDWLSLWKSLRFLPDPPNLIVSSPQADKRLWDEVLGLGGYAVLTLPFEAGAVVPAVHLARSNWLRQREPSPGQLGAGEGVVASTREFRLTRLTAWVRSIGSQWLNSHGGWKAATELEKRAPAGAPEAGEFERIEPERAAQVCTSE